MKRNYSLARKKRSKEQVLERSRETRGPVALLGGEAHWLKPPTLARHHDNHLHELFTTGGSGKEHRTNKLSPTGRVQERSKGDATCPTTSQNPSLWHQSWLNKACTTRKDSDSEWFAKDNLETNLITVKPEPWQSSSPGFPYPTALHPGAPSQ